MFALIKFLYYLCDCLLIPLKMVIIISFFLRQLILLVVREDG